MQHTFIMNIVQQQKTVDMVKKRNPFVMVCLHMLLNCNNAYRVAESKQSIERVKEGRNKD